MGRNLYHRLFELLYQIKMSDGMIDAEVIVNINFNDFIKKYIGDEEEEFITFYGYPIQKLEDKFIIRARHEEKF